MAETYHDVIVTLLYWVHIFQQTHTFSILLSSLELLRALWYWFLGSLALTATIMTYLSPADIRKVLQHLNGWDLLLAALLGIVSPLGTYAVIPIVAVLISSGAPLAPLVAFLISSPLMNPTIFLLTAGGMGMEMAIARVISAILLATGSAWTVRHLEKGWTLPGDILKEVVNTEPRGPFHHHKKSMERLRNHKYQNATNDVAERRFDLQAWTGNFKGQVLFAGRYFLFAILVSALIKEFVPPYLISSAVGQNARYSVLLAAAAGVPFYTCGGAAIPVMRILAEEGMDKGAILAFFITGPATNISTILTMGALFKPRFLAIYYLATIGGAVLMGYLYRLI